MKNFAKTFSAIMAAAVIFGTSAIPISADKLKVTDGIIYKYDDNSNLIGKFSGWAETDGVSRRYIDGKPYTGWLKNKDGTYKYVLDGYIVKGEFPIKNTVCTFDENGILIDRKIADIIVWQDGQIYEGEDGITTNVEAVRKGSYNMYDVEKFERWENGEWVDCLGNDVEYVTYDIIYNVNSEDITLMLVFENERYTGGKINAGYYRMTFPASDGDNGFNVYAIIKVENKITY
ncbi:MAG: hypothetical protein K2K44_12580 [Oscillospiraceae bacterium]|nr:hypothetical protein [Oscillospiraceae bacterium]